MLSLFPLWRASARWVNSIASRLPGTNRRRFALRGGQRKGKAIKAIVKEMKTPEMRNQFGAAYHPDHMRQTILKEMK